MLVTVERLSPVLVEFLVKVPADEVKQSMDKAFNDLARTANVRGFRKGKAPRHVLAHLFGDRIALDVANRLIDDTLGKALTQHKIQPVSSPVIEKPKASPSEDFSYRARFEVTPVVEKVDFEGFEVKRAVYEATATMIDAELEKLRTQHSTLVAPSDPRPVRKGDVVTIDWSLEIEGKLMDAATSKDVTAEVGSPSLLAPLSDALVDKTINAQFDVELVFPDNHVQEALRGKPAKFHVLLKEIKERVLPAPDDEFAKDVGQFDTLDALKKGIAERLQKALKERSDNEVAEALVAELCKRNPIPVPPSLVEQQTRMQENEVLEQARRQGHNAKSVSPELRKTIAADAEQKVRAGLLMAEIAKSKGLQVNDEDIQKAYQELAEQTGKNINKIKVQYQDRKQREMLIGLIVEDKVLNIIEAAAKIEDVSAPAQS
jgi:trigger factor